jgi:hypothetical protein
MSKNELRMDAYYYGFEPTGVRAVDELLSTVACAGKSRHHTDEWSQDADNLEGYYGPHCVGKCERDWIQNAANRAADAFRALAARDAGARCSACHGEGEVSEHECCGQSTSGECCGNSVEVRVKCLFCARDAGAVTDTQRIDWLADQPVFDNIGNYPLLDVYELSCVVAEQRGRMEPNADDQREAFRRLIDAALVDVVSRALARDGGVQHG